MGVRSNPVAPILFSREPLGEQVEEFCAWFPGTIHTSRQVQCAPIWIRVFFARLSKRALDIALSMVQTAWASFAQSWRPSIITFRRTEIGRDAIHATENDMKYEFFMGLLAVTAMVAVNQDAFGQEACPSWWRRPGPPGEKGEQSRRLGCGCLVRITQWLAC
jgi:hypothetical protein